MPKRRAAVHVPAFAPSTSIDQDTRSNTRHATAAELIAAQARGTRLTRRQRVYLLLNEPVSSKQAMWLGRGMWLMLFLYAASTTCQTIVTVTEATTASPFIVLRYFFNVIFSLEAFARICSYQPMKAALKDPFVWIDVATVLPFWLRLMALPNTVTPGTYLVYDLDHQGMRVLEAVSTVRLLKLCRYYDGAGLLYKAAKKALQQLFVPLFMLLILVFCFAAIMFEIVRGRALQPAQ